MTESWKSIDGISMPYSVSNYGRVRNDIRGGKIGGNEKSLG